MRSYLVKSCIFYVVSFKIAKFLICNSIWLINNTSMGPNRLILGLWHWHPIWVPVPAALFLMLLPAKGQEKQQRTTPVPCTHMEDQGRSWLLASLDRSSSSHSSYAQAPGLHVQQVPVLVLVDFSLSKNYGFLSRVNDFESLAMGALFRYIYSNH